MEAERSLTFADLKRELSYDPETGVFSRGGEVAGWVHTITLPTGRKYSRRKIRVRGGTYFASRLAWLYMTGEWPAGDLDHEDRDGLNDRWSNLRPATVAQNGANRAMPKRTTSLPRWVWLDARHKARPFRAEVVAAGKRHKLGRFATADEAHAAALEKAKQVHGEFAFRGAA